MKTSILKVGSIVLFLSLTLLSCNRSRDWETAVVSVTNISHDQADVEVIYDVKNFESTLDGGIYYGEESFDKAEEWTHELTFSKSGTQTIELGELDANTTYVVQSFIHVKNDEYIYSSQKTFTTNPVPEAPCEPAPSYVEFDDSGFSISNLSGVTHDDYYQHSASCAYGELTFTFLNRPKSNVYKTKAGVYSQEDGTVEVSGIFGGLFTCYYRADGNQDIYVNVSEEGNVSIEFCSIKMTTTQSCETHIYLTGEAHE